MSKSNVVVVFVVFLAACIGWGFGQVKGHQDGIQSATQLIKSTCDDKDAPTILNGESYMCVSKDMWNQTLNFVFKQGYQAGAQHG